MNDKWVLRGQRILLRPLEVEDFEEWRELRYRNIQWLCKWEPRRPTGQPDPADGREIFASRCTARHRDRQLGTGYGFGIFVGKHLAGELNLSNVIRGAYQNAHIGYWVGEAQAGRGYVPEAVVAVSKFAFEEVGLHRLQVSIVPRNRPSRRVVEKLGFRCEGLAERYLEIDGVWEDHLRFALTAEEWFERGSELSRDWL